MVIVVIINKKTKYNIMLYTIYINVILPYIEVRMCQFWREMVLLIFDVYALNYILSTLVSLQKISETSIVSCIYTCSTTHDDVRIIDLIVLNFSVIFVICICDKLWFIGIVSMRFEYTHKILCVLSVFQQ